MKRTAMLLGFALLAAASWPPGADGYYIGQNSIAALEAARTQDPTNYAVNYFLGRIYYKEGRRQEAADAWEAYLQGAPDDGRSRAVREHLTVLKIELAQEQARQALRRGGPAGGQMPANTIAVTDFQNRGGDALVPFVKGLTAMIITDLAKVPELRVLERARIKALMQEMQLGLATGLVSRDSAPRIGQLLGARNIAWGQMDRSGGGDLSITSIVTEVVENTTLKEADVAGAVDRFFELQKRLVFGILEAVGIRPDDLPAEVRQAVERVHTTSVEALIQFGIGVDNLDAGNFAAAKEAFGKALEIDPGFDLAGQAEAATPIDAAPPVPEDPGAEPTLAEGGEADGTTGEETSGETGDTAEADGDTGDGTTTTDDTTTDTTTTDLATDTTTTTTVTDVSQQTTTSQTTTLYDGSGMWFLSTILVNQTSFPEWVEDVFLGHSDSPSVVTQQVNSVEGPPDAILVDADTDTILSAVIGGMGPYPVNQQGSYTRKYIDQWIDYGYYTNPNSFTAGAGTYHFLNVWYLSGDNLETPSLSGGPYHYSGDTYGTYHASGTPYDISGSFSCDINFSTNHIENFNLSATDGTRTASITGTGSFVGNPNDPYLYSAGGTALLNGATASGFAVGSVFGPNGERTGGTWGIYKDSNNGAAGVFAGSKQ